MMGKKHRVIAICMLLMMLFCSGGTVCAAEMQTDSTVTIRVAFYQLDGFFEYDSNGEECGYGVDYLQELKKYMNVNWEFIPVDSWEKTGPMMRNGEVDMRMPVTEPSSPSKEFNYTVEAVLPTYHAIMTLDNRKDLYYKDYDGISKMRIAVVEGLFTKNGLMDYLDSIGVSDKLVFYDDYNSCKAALEKGEVDGLISNIMDLTDNMKILDKFAVAKTYISTLKTCPYYAMINSAMTELELENPSFSTNLYESYYPERTIEPFTKEEEKYREDKDLLTVAVFPDRQPVCYYDEKSNSYKGIAIDLANIISDKIGIPFQYISITSDNQVDMLDQADLVMPVAQKADLNKYFVTSSLMDSNIQMVIRAGDVKPADNAKVGVLSSTKGIREAVEQHDTYEIVIYNSNQEALRALQKGEIDGFANISYVTNWLLENPRYDDLSVLHYQSLPLEYLICGKVEDDVLRSIIDKSIKSITEDDRINVVEANTNYSISNLSVLDKLYINRQGIITTFIIICLVAAAIIIYNQSRTKYINEIEEKSLEQEKANHAKSAFLSRMSHDMRTPMNAIIGMSYLGMQSDTEEEYKEYLQKINQSGTYLLGLINDTLDMSKMDSDKMELHLEPYSSTEFIQAIQVLFAQKVKEKNIDFSISINEQSDRTVLFDKLRLQQIFVNLINNAIKFSNINGKVEFRIIVDKVTDQLVHVTFTVKDHGCGMTEEFQKIMYEPFEQGEQLGTDKENGTGLGLAIVKRLVELMGGTIACESIVGQGTTFRIDLEAQIHHGPIEQAEVLDEESTKMALQGKRVLLCEDHPLNVMIAQQLLQKEDMIVEVAGNGQEGIDMFCQSQPDYYQVILMDIRMPVMDGLTAATKIRELEREDAHTIPIIAMTANAFDEDVDKSIKAGMNAHLAKPIEVNVLYETLVRLCTSDK